MQLGGRAGASGQHERAQWREVLVELVDLIFQPHRLGFDHPQARMLGRFLAVALGHAQIGAKIEQVILDARQHVADRGRRRAQVQPRDANDRIGLIDGAVGLDPQVELRHPLARTKRRRPGIAGAGVNACQCDHG